MLPDALTLVAARGGPHPGGRRRARRARARPGAPRRHAAVRARRWRCATRWRAKPGCSRARRAIREALADAIGARYWATLGPDRVDERLAVAAEANLLAERLGDRASRRGRRGDRARRPPAARRAGRGRSRAGALRAQLADEMRRPVFRMLAAAALASRATSVGEFEAAERHLEDAHERARGSVPYADALCSGHRLWLEFQRGGQIRDRQRSRADRRRRRWAASSGWAPPRGSCVRSRSSWPVTREAERRALDEAARDGFDDFERDEAWLLGMAMLSLAVARVGTRRARGGARREAPALSAPHGVARPHAQRGEQRRASTRGPGARRPIGCPTRSSTSRRRRSASVPWGSGPPSCAAASAWRARSSNARGRATASGPRARGPTPGPRPRRSGCSSRTSRRLTQDSGARRAEPETPSRRLLRRPPSGKADGGGVVGGSYGAGARVRRIGERRWLMARSAVEGAWHSGGGRRVAHDLRGCAPDRDRTRRRPRHRPPSAAVIGRRPP